MKTVIDNWVYGGFPAALMLVIAAVGISRHLSPPLLLIFLLIPGYMLHQAEEHFDDRFRKFVEREIGKGRSVLTNRDIFLINVPGLWGAFAVCFALACRCNIGFGLVPAYAALINVAAHVMPAIATRRYNPGLFTSLTLLLPLSCWTISAVDQAGGVPWQWHLVGIASGTITHTAIFGLAAMRLRSRIA